MKIYDNQVELSDGIEHASMEQAVMHYAIEKGPKNFAMHVVSGFFFINGLSVILPHLNAAKLQPQDATYQSRWETASPLLLLIGRETTKETKDVLLHLEDTINVQLSTVDQDAVDQIRDMYKKNLLSIRIYTDKRLHAKMFFFLDEKHIKEIFVGSSNLTSSGLTQNLELTSPIRMNDDEKDEYQKWFYLLWKSGRTDFDLLSVIDRYNKSKYLYFPPRQFFLHLIKVLNKDFLFYEIPRSGLSVLLEFQQFDHYSVVNKMRMFGGTILATSVGLGKSYVALELMRYTLLRNQKVLLIVPSRMQETPKSTWNVYLKKPEFNLYGRVTVIGDGMLQQKQFDWSSYLGSDLIIVDEAHRFRNPSNKRRNLIKFLQENAGIKPDAELFLMTATPINVHLSDLYRLIDLFYELHKPLWQDKEINQIYQEYKKKVDDIERLLQKGDEIEDDELKSSINELLKYQKEIENELIQRSTRSTVQEHFKEDLKRISGFDKILEPKVKAQEIIYTEPYLMRIIQDLPDLLESLQFEYGKFRIMDDLSVTYEDDKEHLAFQKWTLFKRFDSSIYALYRSLTNLLFKFRTYFEFFSNPTRDLSSSSLDDNLKEKIGLRRDFFNKMDIDDQKLILGQMQNDANDTEAFMRAHFEDKVLDIDPITMKFPGDKKIDAIAELLQQSTTEGKKCLIFTEYRDTLDYLKQKLPRGEIAFTHGGGIGEYFDKSSSNYVEEELEEILTKFKSNESKHLISTDVVSEGENLPEADIVVNFDLPYNPVRIIQRCGRATRIDHPKEILIINFTISVDLAEVAKKLKLRFHNLINFIGIDFQVWEGFEEAYRKKNQKDIQTAGEFLTAWREAITTQLPEKFVRGTTSKDEIDNVLLKKAISHFNLEQADLPVKSPSKPIFTTLIAPESKIFGFYKIRDTLYSVGKPEMEIINADKRKYLDLQLTAFFKEIFAQKKVVFQNLQGSANLDKRHITRLLKIKKDYPQFKNDINIILNRKHQSNVQLLGILKINLDKMDLKVISETLKSVVEWGEDTEVMSVHSTYSTKREPERIMAFIQYLGGEDLDI